MLLVPMTAFAVTIDPSIDTTNDKITITGTFDEADGAEDKIATLIVVNPGKNLSDFATDDTVINWADQCTVKNGEFTFVIDTSATQNGAYSFYISVPGVAKTFDGTFNYDGTVVENAILTQLNDRATTKAGIDTVIRESGKVRITAIDATVVADYEALRNPMNVAHNMVGKRPFASLNDFVTKLRAAVNAQALAERTPSGGGTTSSFGGGASAGIVVPEETNPFLDIANSYWGKDAIINLYNKGIVAGQGNGYFRPDNTITRAEFVQMVVKAFGFVTQGSGADFADVTNEWFADSVQAAYTNGVVNGTSATTFSPLSNITRQDMMTILYNAAKAKGVKLTNGSASFTDADSISAYAQDAVAAMVGSNVVSGYTDGSVKPLNNASRAEAAAMLSRLLEVK